MSFKKKLLSLCTAAACGLSAFAVFGQLVDYSDENNQVSALTAKTAKEITSEMTIGWNLGNTLDSTNSSLSYDASPKKFATAWGNPEPTKELIETVKNAGFNTVRIPTTWYQHIQYNESTQTYVINPTWMAYVKQYVDYAYDDGMFVILNIHHEDWINVPQFTDATLAKASDMMEDVWSQIATEFKDYDQHLVFEGMNEPRQTGNSSVSEWGNGSGDNGYSWKYINTLNSIFINTVRNQGSSSNNERLLMIPGYVATADTTALNNVAIPANSGNVALSVHSYSPYFFAMDTGTYSNHTFPGKSGYGEDYETSLTTLFSNLKSVSDSKNVPIVMGEFSASDFNNTTSRVNWAKSYLSKAKAAGIPCMLWDNNVAYNGTGEAHGYVYRLTNTWYKNSSDVVKAMMDTVGVTNYVLPEYKEYVSPAFSWDNITIGDNWQQMYYSKDGTAIDAWGNTSVSNWKSYVTDKNTKYAMIYDSTTLPELVLQGGWYRITCDEDLSQPFIAYFTYDELVKTLAANGTSLDEMDNLFISATSGTAKVYGLYAIPEGSQETTTTETTVDTTTETTVNPTVTLGDVNLDGTISIADIVKLKKYILNQEDLTAEQKTPADANKDNKINSLDVSAILKILIEVA